ncbi:MAG: HAD hydrolase-like protein, partial [Bacilli bacterium]|nr:HAD hydrolase-like protein [Bacilli bacterium]
MKPTKKVYKKVIKEYNKDECIFIGDQFMTDVLGAKRSKFKIILVDRINNSEPLVTKFWRFFEKRILNYYKKNNKFNIYNYYDNLK